MSQARCDACGQFVGARGHVCTLWCCEDCGTCYRGGEKVNASTACGSCEGRVIPLLHLEVAS